MIRSRSITSLLIVALTLTAISSIAYCETAESVSIEYATIRHAFVRPEIADIKLKINNNSPSDLNDLVLTFEIADVVGGKTNISQIKKTQGTTHLFRVDTALLKNNKYTMTCLLASGKKVLAKTKVPIWISRKWNPDRMRVWMWPHHKFGVNVYKLDDEAKMQLDWYADKGFNSFNPGGGVREAHNNFGGYTKERFELYDYCLYNGLEVGFAAENAFFLEDEIDDPDAKYKPKSPWKPFENFTNPFNKEVAALQNSKNEKIMQQLRHFPGLKTCYLESEMEQCLPADTPGAIDMPDAPFPTSTKHEFIMPGVIADTDAGYLKHLYKYKWGDGLVTSNLRTAEIVHKYRPDMLIFSDPLRYTTTYNRFKGTNATSTWIYTNPDPKFILYIETLIANGKPFGQRPIQTITMLNYPGTIAPKDKGWTLMGPDRTVETSWLTLSRNPQALGYYIGSGCDPFRPGYTKNVISADRATPKDTRIYPYCQYPESFDALKKFIDDVVTPYGPMISKLKPTKRKVAVLSSESSSVYSNSPKLVGHYPPFQIYNFYAVLNMAHIPADIVLDETITMFGLDDYDVLFMPKCDTITKTVYDKIIEFQNRGGSVISDQYLRAPIPDVTKVDFDFTYRSKVSTNALVDKKDYAELSDNMEQRTSQLKAVKGVTAGDDQKIMESYAKQLRKATAPVISREVDCSSATALLNMLQADGVKYLFVVNDKRTYGQRFGQYQGILEEAVPQRATITLNDQKTPVYIYDMLEKKQLDYDQKDAQLTFEVDLPAPGGKLIAISSQQIGKLEISTAKTITTRGVPEKINVYVKDKNGRLFNGATPVRVEITDPAGKISEFSDYYAADNGLLSIDFIPAGNDIAGKWKITASELFTKKTKTVYCNIK